MDGLIANLIDNVSNESLRYKYSEYIDNSMNAEELLFASTEYSTEIASDTSLLGNAKLKPSKNARKLKSSIASFLVGVDKMYKSSTGVMDEISMLVSNDFMLNKYYSDTKYKHVLMIPSIRNVADILRRASNLKDLKSPVPSVFKRRDAFSFKEVFDVFKYPGTNKNSLESYGSVKSALYNTLHGIIKMSSDIKDPIEFTVLYSITEMCKQALINHYGLMTSLDVIIQKTSVR